MTKVRLNRIFEIINKADGVSITLDGDFLTIKFPYSKAARTIFGKVVVSSKDIEIKWCKMCGCIEVVGKQKYCAKCTKKRQHLQYKKSKSKKSK